jgi:hypothetical protein
MGVISVKGRAQYRVRVVIEPHHSTEQFPDRELLTWATLLISNRTRTVGRRSRRTTSEAFLIPIAKNQLTSFQSFPAGAAVRTTLFVYFLHRIGRTLRGYDGLGRS